MPKSLSVFYALVLLGVLLGGCCHCRRNTALDEGLRLLRLGKYAAAAKHYAELDSRHLPMQDRSHHAATLKALAGDAPSPTQQPQWTATEILLKYFADTQAAHAAAEILADRAENGASMPPEHAALLAQHHLRRGDWEATLQFCDSYHGVAGTHPQRVFPLQVAALYRLQRYQDALSILDAWEKQYPNAAPPTAWRPRIEARLRAEAQD